jgi:uncharacterized spore protein YtfJ
MEEIEIVIDTPVIAGGFTLIPVTQISKNYRGVGEGTAFLITRRPVAVIVVSPNTKKAFRITGEESSLEDLLNEYHVLKDYMKSHGLLTDST